MISRRPLLARLAKRYGILSAYRDVGGKVRETSDPTRESLLAAMGVEASSEAAAGTELERIRAERARRPLAPVRVAVGSAARNLSLPAAPRASSWEIEVRQEDGTRRCAAGRRAGDGSGATEIRLPFRLPPGYHELSLGLKGRDGTAWCGEQILIVTPERCPSPFEVLGRRRGFGILANLYTVRSARNIGIGDLTDLGTLAEDAALAGSDFLGVNPLHAIDNCGPDISPYSPLSRLYRNPLYLDVNAIPELAESPPVRARLARREVRREIRRLRESQLVDYERIQALVRPLLLDLHRTFRDRHRDRDTARGRAYRRYLAEQGETLRDFATFLALRSHLVAEGGSAYWRQWPSAYRDPHSPAVEQFRRAHNEEIDFHCYLQFEIDRQLAAVASRARGAGMRIGIYEDLALGSADGGSDAWAFPGLFLEGARVGAPPDEYAAEGQNWGLPPIDPHRLAADGYRYWIRLVRAALARAGALRIDHVMGLARQFWIPIGRSGTDGAYVRFPFDDLVGILALESTRAGALVIGEDLGTVPAGFPSRLRKRGILSNRVLYFARTGRGTFWPSRRYPENALVSANTHDMVPLAGFWTGTDLDIRRTVGLIESDGELADAHARRAEERRRLVRRLRAEGVLTVSEPDDVEFRCAVHAFLCRTPAALVGLGLDDLAGEVTPVNQPGVSLQRYPSWSRKMRLTLEELREDAGATRAREGASERARRRERGGRQRRARLARRGG